MKTEVINKEKLSDEKVNVKIGICGKCNGIVRVAIAHKMGRKSKNEFAKEVIDFNLSLKEKPLIEYRKEKAEWCICC